MDIMTKFITALSLVLLIGTASAQNTAPQKGNKGDAETKKKGPIIILCMPFPTCEELEEDK
jgi:hypothetical protein